MKDKKPTTLYGRIEQFGQRNDRKIFIVLLSACIFLSLISFNARISEAHDDALYLEGGWRFVNEFPGYFYTQNAPLYVMFLALMIKTVGFRLILFKLFSVIFNTLGFAFFYRALKGRIPYAVLLPVAVFHAVNHLIMYFASMTFTEAFYFFLQGFFMLQVMRMWDAYQRDGLKVGTQWRTWLAFGLSMFLMSVAKSSAIVVVPAVILFFAMQKQWKAAGVATASYLVFRLLYAAVVRLVWGAQNQFAGQGKILLQKDPYDKSLGNEDLPGFITRLVDNTNLSLSKRFYQIIGWMSEDSLDTYWLLTAITLGLAVYGLIRLYKAGYMPVVLIGMYSGAQLLLSYLILQVRWDQPRITLVCMPAVLIMIFYGLYEFTSMKPGRQGWYLAIVFLVCGSVCISSIRRGFANLPIVQKNLKGDAYYGYTPDWRNFLKCSEWCADSLPETALVASRKAPMSFVYGRGRRFFPIYSVVKKDSLTNMSQPDSALAFLKQNGVTHVMLGHLRMDPRDPARGYINTVHNIMYPIAKKYPWRLTLIHTEALVPLEVPEELLLNPAELLNNGGQYEECYVYRINY